MGRIYPTARQPKGLMGDGVQLRPVEGCGRPDLGANQCFASQKGRKPCISRADT